MTNLTNVVEKANELNNDKDTVLREIKRVASIKCRHKKLKGHENYEQKMIEILAEEQLLKEVRDYLSEKKVTFTTMNDEQIKELTYEETIRAIKSIQSRKCNNQYDEAIYNECIEMEKKLLAHKQTVKKEENVVTKANINDIINLVENVDEIDKDKILEMLRQLKK